jgi:hypothetical protein
MPVHDWSRVSAGTFHDFHCAWIVELRNVLNGGLLPPDYYALAEQKALGLGPDVLTLQEAGNGAAGGPRAPDGTATTLVLAPPQARFTATVDTEYYAARQRTLVIRQASDDRAVALAEIVSPGNKASRHGVRSFLDKVEAALSAGLHLLILDVHPPGRRDPNGVPGLIWDELGGEPFTLPAEQPLTLAAFEVVERGSTTTFVETVSVGSPLPNMPLFLAPGAHVLVPLEAAYQAAYRGVPRRWRDVLEAPSPK